MKYGYQEIGAVVATFGTTSALTVGTPVKMKESGVVEAAASGDDPIGVVVSIDGDEVGVQIGGCIECACEDGTLAVGFGNIQANGTGGIAKGTTGKTRLILAVDTTAKTATVML